VCTTSFYGIHYHLGILTYNLDSGEWTVSYRSKHTNKISATQTNKATIYERNVYPEEYLKGITNILGANSLDQAFKNIFVCCDDSVRVHNIQHEDKRWLAKFFSAVSDLIADSRVTAVCIATGYGLGGQG
jgi:hypothetical protein